MLLRTAEQVRESARARVRLMSDSQLGLSPEEKLNALRQKFAARKMAQSESKGSLAARTLFTDEPKSNPTSINYDFLENDNKVKIKVLRISFYSWLKALKLWPSLPENIRKFSVSKTEKWFSVLQPVFLLHLTIKSPPLSFFCRTIPHTHRV